MVFGKQAVDALTDGGDTVPEEDVAANESQRSDASALTLERNSFNFLEYVQMDALVTERWYA